LSEGRIPLISLLGNSTSELTWGTYNTTSRTLPFPLQNGFIVPRSIGSAVKALHKNPFLWWAGQFAKFTMRLTKEQVELVNVAKRSIDMDKWSHPTVGYAEGYSCVA
jgi:hypothetical protein